MRNPVDSSQWLNLQGYFSWKQPTPSDRDSYDVERRELWYLCTGYLFRAEDASAFLEWAESVNFWGRWMPDPPEIYQMFLGEHVWSCASRYFQQPYFGDDGWIQPKHDCPIKLRVATLEYRSGGSSFDCSVDESYSLRLPASELVHGIRLRLSDKGADFVNNAGILAAFDPTAHSVGPNSLLVREDLLAEWLAREKFQICWSVIGEKRVLGAGFSPSFQASTKFTGAYVLGERGVVGFIKCLPEKQHDNDVRLQSDPMAIIRSTG